MRSNTYHRTVFYGCLSRLFAAFLPISMSQFLAAAVGASFYVRTMKLLRRGWRKTVLMRICDRWLWRRRKGKKKDWVFELGRIMAHYSIRLNTYVNTEPSILFIFGMVKFQEGNCSWLSLMLDCWRAQHMLTSDIFFSSDTSCLFVSIDRRFILFFRKTLLHIVKLFIAINGGIWAWKIKAGTCYHRKIIP